MWFVTINKAKISVWSYIRWRFCKQGQSFGFFIPKCFTNILCSVLNIRPKHYPSRSWWRREKFGSGTGNALWIESNGSWNILDSFVWWQQDSRKDIYYIRKMFRTYRRSRGRLIFKFVVNIEQVWNFRSYNLRPVQTIRNFRSRISWSQHLSVFSG